MNRLIKILMEGTQGNSILAVLKMYTVFLVFIVPFAVLIDTFYGQIVAAIFAIIISITVIALGYILNHLNNRKK